MLTIEHVTLDDLERRISHFLKTFYQHHSPNTARARQGPAAQELLGPFMAIHTAFTAVQTLLRSVKSRPSTGLGSARNDRACSNCSEQFRTVQEVFKAVQELFKAVQKTFRAE